MKLSKNSNFLMSYFMKHNFIIHNPLNIKIQKIIMQLYYDILDSYTYITNIKKISNYNVSITKIKYVNQIPKPNTFNISAFPENILKTIDNISSEFIQYNFSLFNKDITLYFICEKNNTNIKIDVFNKYVDAILMWMYILNKYSVKKCSKKFTVYFYFTSLEKRLPKSNISTLNENHVNTAFTRTCQINSEIVIFRKEEWFKVFIHETFHNFGLDFSENMVDECKNFILNIFPIKSDVNLYEAYTECWAEIINAVFCSFISLKDKQNINMFLSNYELFINFERTYSFFQLVKTLDFMGLKYKDLYSQNMKSKLLRDTLYKEDTNVLSYYIIKTILINNYEGFLSWCNNNNISLLQFNNTTIKKKEFCKFIEGNYKINSMNNGIKIAEQYLSYLKSMNKTVHNLYVINNLRMTICELN